MTIPNPNDVVMHSGTEIKTKTCKNPKDLLKITEQNISICLRVLTGLHVIHA